MSRESPVVVKICGFTRPADVELAVAAGADAIGLVLADDGSPCRVDHGRARELLAAVGPAEAVAVVGRMAASDLTGLARALAGAPRGFDVVQAVVAGAEVGGPEGAWGRALTQLGAIVPVFFDNPRLVSEVEAWTRRWPLPTAPDGRGHGAEAPGRSSRGSVIGTVNVDGPAGGGKGVRADWARVAALAATVPVTLAGGLRVDNVAEAIAAVRPAAVDVTSGTEAAPGIKDPAKLRAFIAAARGA